MPHLCAQCPLMFTDKRQLSMHLYDVHSPVHYTNTTRVKTTTTRVNGGKVKYPIEGCGVLLSTQCNFYKHLKRHEFPPPPLATASTTTPAPPPAMVTPISTDVAQLDEDGNDDALIVSATPLWDGMSYVLKPQVCTRSPRWRIQWYTRLYQSRDKTVILLKY